MSNILTKTKVMKQQIYQNGFWLLSGLIIGALIMLAISSGNSRTEQTIKIEITGDSVKKVSKTIPLNEDNLRAELKSRNVPHAEIVLAQAKLETGNFTSDLVDSHQNIFGLRKGKSYRKFSHWTECVMAYSSLISSRYKGGSYYAFLERIGYAEDPDYIKKLKAIA